MIDSPTIPLFYDSFIIISRMIPTQNEIFFKDGIKKYKAKLQQMGIINYFISSNMLDILFLSSENGRGKGSEKESMPKEERFNQIFAKLRQRNAHNDCIIKKYVKKMVKRKVKFPQDQETIQNQMEEQFDKQAYRGHYDLPVEEQDLKQEEKQKLIRSDNLLKATNHTLTQYPSQLNRKLQTLPVIDFSSTNNFKNEQSPKTNAKQTLQPYKYDKQFNKYLRNVFFKEIAAKAEPNKVMTQLKNHVVPLRTSQNRIKTETSTHKYQLSIKSLIFGNQQISPQKKRDQNQSKNKRIFDQVSRHVSKHQKDDLFRDDNFSTKGMLPLISSQSYTNKKCIESDIRKTSDKIKEGKQSKGVRLPNYADPTGQNEGGSRIGLSFRIHTIQIKQQF